LKYCQDLVKKHKHCLGSSQYMTSDVHNIKPEGHVSNMNYLVPVTPKIKVAYSPLGKTSAESKTIQELFI